jgi:hypothetical protein
MAITCSILTAPTNLSATLLAGGSLAANTTYYYVVVAFDSTYYTPYYTPASLGVLALSSPISAEGSFTTTSTNKSVKINWTNVVGGVRYQIFLTTTSGDYHTSRGYDTIGIDTIGSISDGVAGYTISAINNTNNYICHSIQLRNSLLNNINKGLGILKINLTGSNNYNLNDIYNAIIAQGYSDYVTYNGFEFVLKGFIIADSTATEAGSLVIENKNLIFIKGGVINTSPAFVMRFGRWMSDEEGADMIYSCGIDLQNGRTPFYGYYTGSLLVYGCTITASKSRVTTLTETLSILYYHSANNLALAYNVSGIKESYSGIPFRSTSSDCSDLKWYNLNNYSNYKHTRLKLVDGNLGYYSSLPYTATPGGFYACKWLSYPAYFRFYAGLASYSNHKAVFYDNEFPDYQDGEAYNKFFFMYMTESQHTTNQTAYFYYSLIFKVIDKDGMPLSGVTITGKDANDENIIFYENDGTTDKWVTGNEYTSITTNIDGEADYYTESYNIKLKPDNTTFPTSTIDDLLKDEKYPIKLSLSKEGFNNYSIIIDRLNQKTNMLLTLEDYAPPTPTIYYHQQLDGVINNNILSAEMQNNTITGEIINNISEGKII